MRKKTNSRNHSPFSPITGVLVVLLAVLMSLPLILVANRRQTTDLTSKANTLVEEFVQAQGKDLIYKGQKVVLRGTNFDNIPALGAGIGSNNINDIRYNDEDYRTLSSFGGNHVRFGLSFSWYEKDRNQFFAKIDEQVALARKNNIWISLLPFTNPDGGDGCYEGYSTSCSIWTSSQYKQQLLDFWLDIAARYKDEPAVVGYDLINEPTPPGPGWCKTWYDLAQSMRNKVAQVAPYQLVFISACSDPSFDRVFKEADGVTKAKNVVYEVHDYDPMKLSHTGYNAQNTTATYPGNATAWVDGVQKSFYFDKSTFEGTRYPGQYSTAEQYSVNWANKNGVPLYIGEWGAQGWLKGHAQYIQDKAEVYTQLGVNHAYYTWRHSVLTGWRWGLFPTTGALVVQDPAKLEAAKVSWRNSLRPSFVSTGATPTPTPTPLLPTPTVAPTAPPTVLPSPTPVTSTPAPTTAPPVTGTYPRQLPSTNSKIRIVETQAKNGNTVYIQAEVTDPSITVSMVDWYVNGTWKSSDKVAPYSFNGDTNGKLKGYLLPNGTTTIRAVVYYKGQQYIDATTQYLIGVPATPVPTIQPTLGVQGTFEIVNEWTNGYCARIALRNTTTRAVRNWKAQFNLNQSKITSQYGASFVNNNGIVTVTPEEWARYTGAGGRNNWTDFCATKTGTNWNPTNLSIQATF